MDPKVQQQLDAILAKASLRRIAEEDNAKQLETAASERQAKHEAAVKGWKIARSHLDNALTEVNAKILSSGMTLQIKEGSSPDKDHVTQVIIELRPQPHSYPRQLVLNVEHDGLVRPVTTSGKFPDPFFLDQSTPDLFSEMIVVYMDQALGDEGSRY
jgi:hypothetical protein